MVLSSLEDKKYIEFLNFKLLMKNFRLITSLKHKNSKSRFKNYYKNTKHDKYGDI